LLKNNNYLYVHGRNGYTDRLSPVAPMLKKIDFLLYEILLWRVLSE